MATPANLTSKPTHITKTINRPSKTAVTFERGQDLLLFASARHNPSFSAVQVNASQALGCWLNSTSSLCRFAGE